MDVFINTLIALGLLPVKSLGESMQQSKCLTIMVIVGVCLLSALTFFLLHMASKQ
ncbi:hypothetical protein [Thalassotalea sediminis]|uniref:hypothetical protein n=1 Tax=Thalassotalea sediminis TaxID=1759089 RepID=UPI0025730EBE|nr:hypothetical protein [Thalassotalea sediminis]